MKKKASKVTPGARVPIPERLSDAMRVRGWNQTRLAQEADLPNATICRILSGRRTPTFGTLTCLADTLGVPLSSLTGETIKTSDGAIDADFVSFFNEEWHELTLETRTWFRITLDMLRREVRSARVQRK